MALPIIFTEYVRVMFACEKYADRLNVSERVITSRSELGKLSTPWYITPNSLDSTWDDQSAERMPVRDPRTLRRLNLDGFGNLQMLHVPVYRTESGEHIILDGNHRVVDLYHSGLAINVRLTVAEGFDDPSLLPDLLHAHKPMSSVDWNLRVTQILA